MTRFQLVYFVALASLTAQQQVGALDSASDMERTYCYSLSITGGHNVSLEDIPFIVAIDDGAALCGGSIIHERFILTAANCFNGYVSPTNATVTIGTDTLSGDGVIFDIEKILCHENFDTDTLDNDICLLKLPSTVPFAWLVQVALPDEDFKLDISTRVNVTGWGPKHPDDPLEDELRQVEIPILPYRCCNKYDEYFNDYMICAGSRGHDLCQGDIGGPLTYNNIQIGVASASGRCGEHPGVYTRVTSYIDWIENTIINNL